MKKKITFMVLLFTMALTLISCGKTADSQKNSYEPLDYEKINTGRTTINMRKAYYKEHVDNLIKDMNSKERNDYYVTLNIKPVSDDLEAVWYSFYRNDNSFVDVKYVNDTKVMLPPGVYRMTFSADEIDEFTQCEFAVLTPGSKVTLTEVSDNHYEIKGDCEITKPFDVNNPFHIQYDNDIDCDSDFDVAANDIKIDYDFESLDPEKVDTETTEIKDLETYYNDHVDRLLYYMDDDEKESYYVKINMEYKNESDYPLDTLVFLRNDNVYKGDTVVGVPLMKLTPGVYSLISADIEGESGNLGEFAILTPGAEITLVVDYESKSIQITKGDGKVTEK